MSSARSFDKKPIVAKLSVRNPANGPKPNIATKKIAMMISCSERLTAMIERQTR